MAQLLSDAEAQQLGPRPFGKKHFIRVLIEQLNVGEKLYVTRADFTWKRKNPSIFISQIMKSGNKKFTISNTRNRSGWIVTRTE